jgi:hypothetical protein
LISLSIVNTFIDIEINNKLLVNIWSKFNK